jgi:hypothetical protein
MTTATPKRWRASPLDSQSAKRKIGRILDADKRAFAVTLRDIKLAEEFAGVDCRLRFATTRERPPSRFPQPTHAENLPVLLILGNRAGESNHETCALL